ncbi:MAG: 2-oxoacid:acceptor oxidoreductase subunit alpha [Bdellovibrio sp.]|nr:MAG: 2-oxoacid:acceptor oxidoreductase subunit alpha [Bdellovibrio sp.]
MKKINDCTIHIATVNGSGSLSANQILARTFFRLGLPISAKNFFPSNIAGLPTWFSIRISPDLRKLSHNKNFSIIIAMNKATWTEDLKALQTHGVFIYNSDLKIDPSTIRADVLHFGLPMRELTKELSPSVHIRKLLSNMVYVGFLLKLLKLENLDIAQKTVADFFQKKPSVIEVNQKALEAGAQYAQQFSGDIPVQIHPIPNGNKDKLLMDGNSAAALGLVFGGCQFLSWYPITPSSSLAESFQKYASKFRKSKNGKNQFVVLQAEDELSSINMVIGAGWCGARAITPTSGPGLSLMGEAAGLSYFAEIPAVIWDVQRAGPSTGLPTRTLQGDLLAAAVLSHGDTQHILLLPSSPKECFEFAKKALDLAEEYQTLVIVLSDLDLGMNLWISERPRNFTHLERGKVLKKEDLEKRSHFFRYEDTDGDGVPSRTLPGTPHPLAAYFTRGTGHTPSAKYSEDPVIFSQLLKRLSKKIQTAKKDLPKPEIHMNPEASMGLIAFGSSDLALQEVMATLEEKNIPTSYMRVRSYPFSEEVNQFIQQHRRIYVIEQNRDAQLLTLLKKDLPTYSNYYSLTYFDGWPLRATDVLKDILQHEGLENASEN